MSGSYIITVVIPSKHRVTGAARFIESYLTADQTPLWSDEGRIMGRIPSFRLTPFSEKAHRFTVKEEAQRVADEWRSEYPAMLPVVETVAA